MGTCNSLLELGKSGLTREPHMAGEHQQGQPPDSTDHQGLPLGADLRPVGLQLAHRTQKTMLTVDVEDEEGTRGGHGQRICKRHFLHPQLAGDVGEVVAGESCWC